MKFIITTFDKNGKPIAETTRNTKEGLDACLNWITAIVTGKHQS